MRSHEDILNRIGENAIKGDLIIQTKDGNRMIEISNNAVWASITLSYQIKIDNFLSDADIESTTKTENLLKQSLQQKEDEIAKEREKELKEKQIEEEKEYQIKLKTLTENLKEKENNYNILLQKEESLKTRLRSVTGPLLLLRETFKTGIYLRDKLCAELDHWNHLRQILKENQEIIFNIHSNSFPENNSLSENHSIQSMWLQDLEYIQKLYLENLENPEIHPLKLTHILDLNPPKLMKQNLSSEKFMTHSESITSINEKDENNNKIQEIEKEVIEIENIKEKEVIEVEIEEKVEVNQENISNELQPNPLVQLPKETKLHERIVVSSSNLKITPSSDFRCPIKIPQISKPV